MPSSAGQPNVVLGVVDVGALEDVFGVARAELVADGGHVAGHGAVAEGDEDRVRRRTFRSCSRLSRLQTAPSTRQTSTPSGYSFTSMTGL
jgi:hypothetical protein